MANTSDMGAPVTRAELRDELQTVTARIDQERAERMQQYRELLAAGNEVSTRLDRVETRMTGFETRMTGLETRMTGLETRMTGLETRMTGLETRMGEVTTQISELPKQMARELQHVTNVMLEALQTQITVVDEQYKDLPARVTTLEAKVFAPKRKRR